MPKKVKMDGISSTFSILRESAFQKVKSQYPDLARTNPRDFMLKVANEFIHQQVNSFPEFCETARVTNLLKWKELESNGHKGKFTGSSGWSKDGQFKFDYDIPEELYLFMQNLVYKDFWSEDNRRIWRKFMKKVCDKEDPEQILVWVKSQYGANSQEGIVN
jgi:hypothetical protein